MPAWVSASPGRAGAASRRASVLAVAVLCLPLATRVSYVLASGQLGQVPFTVALFVLPLAYAIPGGRRLANRHRWLVLAVQAVLTWAPFVLFSGWQIGVGGLLAGLVLLMVSGRASWPLAAGLLAAEVAVRASLSELPLMPAWLGVLATVAVYVDDALVFFGMVRMAQIVSEVEQARMQAADLAVAGERLRAAEELQAAVGQRVAHIAAKAAAARRALSRDAAEARAQMAVVGVTARDAVERARAVTAGDRLPRPELSASLPSVAVISARLARAVLVTVLLMWGWKIAATLSPASGPGARPWRSVISP